jgi:hypothetical protein
MERVDSMEDFAMAMIDESETPPNTARASRSVIKQSLEIF